METVAEPGGRTTAYAFDEAGNRIQETITGSGNTTTAYYSYNEQNRLTSITRWSSTGTIEKVIYTYDNNGNLIFKSKEQNRLLNPAEIETANISIAGQSENDISKDTAWYQYDQLNRLIKAMEGGQTIQYTYNGEGQRVSKETNGQTTNYLYEADKIILELDGSNNQTARNVQGINLISRTVDTDTLYYFYNGHADVTALMDENGTIAAT